jgi:hypothetical protein
MHLSISDLGNGVFWKVGGILPRIPNSLSDIITKSPSGYMKSFIRGSRSFTMAQKPTRRISE